MQEYIHSKEDVIELKQFFYLLWNKKIFISSGIFLFAIFSVLYSLSLPNIYQSKVILAPATSDQSLSSKLSSSAFANIAGIQIPRGEVTKPQEAIKRINSLEFFSKYFLPEIKLENLMAVSEWIPEENSILYDSNIYDSKSKKWVRQAAFPFKATPSNQEAFLVYKNSLSIIEDSSTSFVTIAFEHRSPYISKKWVDIIVKRINSSMAAEEKQIALNSIEYLNEYLESTNIQSIRENISSLQEAQMQTLMLTSSTEFYIFKIIDSAVVPELKSMPNRPLICILGTILGAILSIFCVLLSSYFKNLSKISR